MNINFYKTILIKIFTRLRSDCVLESNNFIPCRSGNLKHNIDQQTLPILKSQPGNQLTNIHQFKQSSFINPNKWLVAFIMTMIIGNAANAAITGPGTAWAFCRKVTLSAATPANNFQVKITLTAGQYANMNAAGNDLRFYDINNNVCNYWIESWNNAGSSVVWVNVVSAASTSVYMYYGNAAAPAVSNGATTFDFFDDFTAPLTATWLTNTSGGSVTQAGTNVTLSNTNGGAVSLSNTNAFTPNSSSFVIETKHQESKYNRNRFYATTGSGGGNPLGFDNGYFYTGANPNNPQNSAQVFWNGAFGAAVAVNTNYLTQWQITDASTYNWKTFSYPAMTAIQTNNTTYASPNIRFISIQVTEVAGTSTIVDWVRVRKASASFTEITGTAGNAVNNISATISAQSNAVCNGQASGSASVTATGGGTPYTYTWNSTPVQNTQNAANLKAGTYIATVTENLIGISATATVVIGEPAEVTANVDGHTNISCNSANDGTIKVSASGGTAPYTFSVDNGITYTSTQTDVWLFTGLSANTPYKIRVKDNVGCQSKLIQ
jgi:Domain of unknown function (DUF2341)/SprB repeat